MVSKKNNRNNIFTFVIFLVIVITGLFFTRQPQRRPSFVERSVETPYGSFVVREPVLIELLDCTALQRLKKIHQYGVDFYARKGSKPYFRYEHSVGVWALLRRYGASLEEQIAGLLHDASHTVFSHVGDFLVGTNSETSSYQDNIHEDYLKKTDVPAILEKHKISLDAILHKSGDHLALEQDLPDICADRLEYNLRGGLLEGLISQKDVEDILEALVFENGRWYFKDPILAAKFCRISLYHTENIWGGPGNYLMYSWAGQALRRALQINLITMHDIHFSTDDIVWEKLVTSSDDAIKKCIDQIKNYKNLYTETRDQDFHCLVRGKFRGIDPWVKQGDTFKRLTTLDTVYFKEYDRVKTFVSKGCSIKILDHDVYESSQFKTVIA